MKRLAKGAHSPRPQSTSYLSDEESVTSTFSTDEQIFSNQVISHGRHEAVMSEHSTLVYDHDPQHRAEGNALLSAQRTTNDDFPPLRSTVAHFEDDTQTTCTTDPEGATEPAHVNSTLALTKASAVTTSHPQAKDLQLHMLDGDLAQLRDDLEKLVTAAYWSGVADGEAGRKRRVDGPEPKGRERHSVSSSELVEKGLWDVFGDRVVRMRRQDPSRRERIWYGRSKDTASGASDDERNLKALIKEDQHLKARVGKLHEYCYPSKCKHAWKWNHGLSKELTQGEELVDVLAEKAYGYADEVHGHLRTTRFIQNPLFPVYVSTAPYDIRLSMVKATQARVREAAEALEGAYENGEKNRAAIIQGPLKVKGSGGKGS